MKTTLNDIVLNGAMLESLYGHSLVDIGNAPKPKQPSLKFLGNNEKKVTVLVDDPDCAFLPDEQLAFLSRMLLACKMNTGDVAILNLANGAPSLSDITDQLSPSKIIAFGVVLQPATPVFTIGRIGDAALLHAPGLAELSADSDDARALKSRLWSCLRNLFDLS